MDTTHDTEKQMVVAEVRRFVEREVIPVAHELEQSDTYPFDLVEGGLGLDFVTYVQIVEELSRGWMSLSGIVNTHILVAD